MPSPLAKKPVLQRVACIMSRAFPADMSMLYCSGMMLSKRGQLAAG